MRISDWSSDVCSSDLDGQDKHREDLADEIVQINRESDEVDIDREQHQLDRHQDDDDVLAVQEDAEQAEREQNGGHGQIMRESDLHQMPLPVGTLTTSTESSGSRRSCDEIRCRLTPSR